MQQNDFFLPYLPNHKVVIIANYQRHHVMQYIDHLGNHDSLLTSRI